MSATANRPIIQIKKYQNRRYYDATRSRHITLQEVHDLIIEGHDVCITDSQTGDDITNLVLTQILLEKDQPKLDLFPSAVLHMMIRTNRNALRATFDRFYGPFLSMMASSQKQLDAYFRKAMKGEVMTPMDWTNLIMQPFTQSQHVRPDSEPPPDTPARAEAPTRPDAQPGSPASAATHDMSASHPEAEEEVIDDLRAQLAALMQRLDELSERREPKTES